MIKLKKHRRFSIFLAVCLLLVFFHLIGLLRPVENFLLFLSKPLSARLYDLGSNFRRSYADRQQQEDLSARLADLSNQVAILTVANANCQEIFRENAKLRAQAKFSSENNFRSLVVSVIAQEGSIAGETGRDLVINRGARDGLYEGLAVTEPNGTVIGKVSSVRETSATVCLVTSPGCKLAAAVENQNQTPGIADGDLGLTIRMDYIPQIDKINVGDIVVTSGLGGNVPRGLVIGRIKEVRNESNAVWQNATIEPLVDLAGLTIVSVITP